MHHKMTPLLPTIQAEIDAENDRLTELALAARARRAAGAAPIADKATRLEAWRAEWATSPEVRATFPTPGGYAAYREAESQGRVRIMAPVISRRH
jgi:hypothetical protein